MDPKNKSALKDMEIPVTADEVCDFIHFCIWMEIYFPNISGTVALLVAVLEEAYLRSGRIKKRSIKGIKLRTLSWGAKHINYFNKSQDSIRYNVRLSYQNPGKSIFIYRDASDKFWSAVETQTEPGHLSLPLEDQ